jgi:hypothetical protein
VVMNYLCGKCGTDGGTPRDDEWLSYFDVVVTGRSVSAVCKVRVGVKLGTERSRWLPQPVF